MAEEDAEKPALVEEMGLMEGLSISKGPQLLPSSEALQEVFEDE